MAVLISKVVKSSKLPSHDGLHHRVLEQNPPVSPSVATNGAAKHAVKPLVASFLGFSGSSGSQDRDMEAGEAGAGGETPLEEKGGTQGRGIVKTVEMTVVVNRSDGSLSGSGTGTRDRSWEV